MNQYMITGVWINDRSAFLEDSHLTEFYDWMLTNAYIEYGLEVYRFNHHFKLVIL